MQEGTAHEALVAALAELQAAVAAQPFAVADPDQERRRVLRDRLAADLDGQLARLREWEAPILAVLGGGTGAGKSTVANSLVGLPVAMTGVIRPTTSSPTLLVGPTDAEWFAGERVLPGLPRVLRADREPAGQEPDPVLHVVTTRAIAPGLAVLDAPDVDSVRTEHAALADQLLDAADVWVWLVTPRTYADEAGMAYLRRAARRRTALGVVLNQVHERDTDELVADLRAKLADEGLDDAEVLVVPYAIAEAHRLPGRALDDLRTWLRELARPANREQIRRQTLDGALDDLRHEVEPLVGAVRQEVATAQHLAGAADQAYAAALRGFDDALDQGLPLREEVLDRWRDFVGNGRVLRMIETAGGQMRTWLRDALSSVTGAEQERVQRQVQEEVSGTIGELAREAVDVAAAEVAATWERMPAGEALLDADPGLRRAGPDLAVRIDAALQGWQEAVVELIRTRGAERKVRARWVSGVLNAGATAAILATFASTGGLTGAETGIALGAGAANQALLAKLLGAHNLQWLQQRVREDLLERMRVLAEAERTRYVEALDPITPDEQEPGRLLAALDAVAEARR